VAASPWQDGFAAPLPAGGDSVTRGTAAMPPQYLNQIGKAA